MGSHQKEHKAIVLPPASGTTASIRLHRSNILAFFRAFDSLLVICVLWGVLQLWATPWSHTYTWLGVLAIIAFVFFAENNEVYHLWQGFSTPALAHRLTLAWAGTALVLGTFAVVMELLASINIRAVALWLAVTPVAIITCHWLRRLVLARFRRQAAKRRIGIVGATSLSQRVSTAIRNLPWMGYQIAGYYDDRQLTDDRSRRLGDDQVKICGNLEQLKQAARNGDIDMVFITLPMAAERRVRELVHDLADTTVSAYLIPDVFSFDLLHARMTGIQGIPALSIYDSPLADQAWSKRLFDLLAGLAILAIVAIPMIAIAIGVKLDSRGPVFFRQARYGVRGEKIRVWKFRSMKVCEDGDDVPQATRDDPRITPFGAMLRRTSLDELPQLFNVLAGSMSLIGPRPHAVAHNEFYRSHIQGYMLRHKVKPGITGLAQINGFRGETETMDKMVGRIAYDLEYIRNWSLWLDIKILWLTAFRGFSGQQAY